MTQIIRAILFGFIALGSTSLGAEECRRELRSGLPLLNSALTNLHGIDYVHHAIDELKSRGNVEFCVSGVAVSRNIYQYLRFYIHVDVRQAGGGKSLARYRFLYQDASVQALHNVGGKPWIAVAVEDADALEAQLKNRSFQPLGSGRPLALIKDTQTFKSDAADLSTLSSVDLGDSILLVTWLTKPGANLYADVARTKAVLLKVEGDMVSVAEGLWFNSEVTKTLDAALQFQVEARGSAGSDLQHLNKISSP